MRSRLIMVGFTLAVCIGVFHGCNKVKDVSIKRFCRIDVMMGFTFYDTAVPRYFTYNQWGNPIRVAFDDSPGTGTPFFDFFYDNNQRLIRFEEFTSHYYTYNQEGLIAIDTIFSGYAGQDYRYEEKFFYDDQKRIIKTITKLYRASDGTDEPPQENPDLNVEQVTEYAYDSNGNLIKPGVVYDKKMNPRRTNSVWMFVDKDYSVNNPLPGPTHYNALGLPLNDVTFLHGFPAEEVVYDCKVLDHPRK